MAGTSATYGPKGLAEAIEKADLGLPAAVTGDATFVGSLRDTPAAIKTTTRIPVVLFLHGSSGLNESTRAWQRWLADELNLASFAPNSLAIPDRIRYTSPTTKDVYEQVHLLRAAELRAGLDALRACSWVDAQRLVVAGTSEGAVAVARLEPGLAAARILYAWSCESNYFVEEHGTQFGEQEPVLNVISIDDPYFSPVNPWHGDANTDLDGHAAAAVKGNRNAVIVLLSGAPHTLYNLCPARQATQAFLKKVLE